MNIHEKLCKVQTELKAPKSQYNSFGKYNYRSLEDISEAVKPLLSKYGLTLTVSDKPVMVGNRIYIEATATLTDIAEPSAQVVNTAYARESETKKGMDDSQITGATSSYARKYCFNGLFCLDDTKDADAKENGPTQPQKQAKTPPFLQTMKEYAKNHPAEYKAVLNEWQLQTAKDVTNPEEQQGLMTEIEQRIKAA